MKIATKGQLDEARARLRPVADRLRLARDAQSESPQVVAIAVCELGVRLVAEEAVCVCVCARPLSPRGKLKRVSNEADSQKNQRERERGSLCAPCFKGRVVAQWRRSFGSAYLARLVCLFRSVLWKGLHESEPLALEVERGVRLGAVVELEASFAVERTVLEP